MSSLNWDQSQTLTTEAETWTQESGLNPRTDWDINWEKHLETGPVAVSFEPFYGLYAIHGSCCGVIDDYAVLKVPPKGTSQLTDWFPPEDECWVIVPEIFLRLQ